MNRAYVLIRKQRMNLTAAYGFLLCMFVCGSALGALTAGLGIQVHWQLFRTYCDSVLTSANPGLLNTGCLCLRFPLLCWTAGFTACGVWLVPLLLFGRGFFLSYTIAAFAASYGAGGYVLSLCLLLFHGLLLLPLLFAISFQSMRRAASLQATGFRPALRKNEILFGAFCLGCIALTALLDNLLTPGLLGLVSGRLGI